MAPVFKGNYPGAIELQDVPLEFDSGDVPAAHGRTRREQCNVSPSRKMTAVDGSRSPRRHYLSGSTPARRVPRPGKVIVRLRCSLLFLLSDCKLRAGDGERQALCYRQRR